MLAPIYAKRDPEAYLATQQAFNAAADPRLFQYKAMPEGPEKKAYLQSILAQDPSLAQKALELKKLGVQ